MIKTSDDIYYIHNGHGDIIQLANRNGDVIKDYEYDAFGVEKIEEASEETELYNPFRYCGEYFDEELGCIYLRARYYDPATSRMLSEDTYEGDIKSSLSLNRYTYCMNNPILYTDPSGHIPTPMEAALMAEHIYSYSANSSYEERIVKDNGNNTAWRLIDGMSSSDLKIGVYIKTDATHDWQNPLEYTVVFKGTDPKSAEDWNNNAQEFMGQFSGHLAQGVAYAAWFVQQKSDYEITFVGHSKGGGEAAVNAELFNKNAIVFNPSVPELAWRLKDEGYVKPYVVIGDILNDCFGELPLGKTKYLTQQHNGRLPGVSIKDKAENHLMSSVISALRKDGYK